MKKIYIFLAVIALALILSSCANNQTATGQSNENTAPSTSESVDNTPTTSSRGLEFSLSNDGKSYSVTGIGICKDENIVIDTYNNLPVTRIEAHCFDSCLTMKSINIGKSVQYIGNYAFISCENLEEISIPSELQNIGSSPFYDCDNLKCNVYDNGLYVGNSQSPYLIFIKPEDENVSSFKMHDETRFMCGKAFYDNEVIENVTLGNKLEYIGDYAFYETRIQSITIPDSVRVIDSGAFQYTALKTIVIPDSVLEIGDNAFCSTPIENITLSNNLTGIASGLFARCWNLDSLTIPKSVEYIDAYAFERTDIDNIVIAEDNPYYKVENECIITKDGKTFVYCFSKNHTVIIPEGVTAIGDDSFRERDYIQKVVMPDTVETIGDAAFYSCSDLSEVVLSKNLKSIGHHGFYQTNLKQIEIPDGVEVLGESLFWECSELETVVIGKGVKEITSGAFSDCKKLTNVIYMGSREEWQKIEIGSNGYLTRLRIQFRG